MSDLTFNEQLLHQAANILSYKGADGKAARDVYGLLGHAASAVDRLLSYKGADGKARRDFYGLVANAPADTVRALLDAKLVSAADGKEYTVEQYLVTNNARLNEAKAKDEARDAAIAKLTTAVAELTALVKKGASA